MNILITAGGTSEKVDCITSIINRSTGEMARQIAEEYERRNDNIHFFYICSENAKLPQVSNILIYRIKSVLDLEKVLNDLLSNYKFDIIIHAMAVSDYTVDGVFSEHKIKEVIKNAADKTLNTVDSDLINKNKIDSDHDYIYLRLKRTPKIIELFRKMQPETILVGFKLLVNSSINNLIQAGYHILKNNRCNFVFANDLNEIKDEKHKGILIDENKKTQITLSKKDAARCIVSSTLKCITQCRSHTN